MDHRDPPTFSELGDFKQWGRFDVTVPLAGGQTEFQAAVTTVRKHIPLRLGGFYIIANEDGILHSGSHDSNLQKHSNKSITAMSKSRHSKKNRIGPSITSLPLERRFGRLFFLRTKKRLVRKR